jgi:predicted ATPase/class 3 adenylate cyclase/ribosomal protein L40E
MKCQKCQSNNPEDSNFCLECGTKMEQVCSHCGKSVPLRAKFCNACGHRFGQPAQSSLKEPSLQEKLEKVQRYLPKGLLKKILSQRDSIEGERRQVTIMFCDVKGFTGMAEKLGPDETFSLMNQVFEIFLQKVNEYQGTVNEFRGDGILAFFGAPIALEDAPQRAIRSALTIHKEIQKFNEKISGRWEIAPIQLRIGLNTGQVVVGTVGNDLRVQYTAQGDTINMAARMESIAEPGTIYVTKETFEQTEGYFRFEALGAQYIKGKAEPLEVYKVIAPSSRRTRFDISAERGLTPFVGRQRELELLIDGYRRSRAGRGQSFSIVSEAGLGKSRLLYEFRKKIVHDNVTFLEGRCLSYSRWIAYHPIIDVLKSNFNLAEADKDKTIAAKVKKGLKAIAANDPDTRAHILELFSIKDAQTQDVFINQEEKRYRLVEALKRVVIKGSEIRPLVLAVEDLHWIDQSSEDAFKSLLNNISGASVFLIFTYRPEYVHTWGTRTYHSQLNLNRFSNRESLLMVHHLLGTAIVEDALEELILEKAEGVPFFIEEFIRSLKDLSIIEKKNNRYCLAKAVHEITIPNTIHDVIMARVDSLPESARSVLVIGSAIEREFSHHLLKNVIDVSEQELLTCLSFLKDAELLYERGLYPNSTYIFKHAVTQEIVYDSIIAVKRKQLHEKIGRTIETLFRENLHDYYGVLAEHYIRSGNYEKSAEFCKHASKQAFGSASFSEATGHVRNLILCLERLPQNEYNQKRIIKARTALAMYLINMSQNEGLLDAVAPIEEFASKLNDHKILARIYIALGTYHYSVEEDIEKGLRYLKNASELVTLSKDFLSAYYAFFYLGCHYKWSCEFSKAQCNFDKCIELSTTANNPIGVSNPKALAAYTYCHNGKIQKAATLVDEGMKAAEQNGYLFCKTPAYTAYGIYCYYKGLFDDAEKHLLMGADFAKKISQIGWEHWACFNLGNLYLDIGNLTQAKKYLNKSLSIIQQYKLLPSWIVNCRIALSKVMVLSNDMNINLHEIVGFFGKNNFNVNRGYIARNIAEILLSLDKETITDAKSWVSKAIENDKKYNVMWSLARDYAVYANCLQMSNEQKNADEYIRKSVTTFKCCEAEGWVSKIEKGYQAFAKW